MEDLRNVRLNGWNIRSRQARLNSGNRKRRKAHGKHFLEVHTSGYDGTFEITEALEWINWTLYDYSANGFLRNF